MAIDARRYLEKRACLQAWPLKCAALDRGPVEIAVVIPALSEQERLFQTLGSLAQNPASTLEKTLVVCVVNNRREPLTAAEDITDNRKTLEKLEAAVNEKGPLRLGYIDAASPGCELPDKGGVGMARKIGLDRCLSVMENNPRGQAEQGVLVCLDADTRVEHNYLDAVRGAFAQPGAWAAVIDYEHDAAASPRQAAGIICYELFLRYHVLGLRYAGSPYAFPTIGSTIACSAGAYVAVAGMNQRQAGEDFYFLQQLAKTGPVRRIGATTVYPSPRASHRVPFGTGQRVRRFLDGGQDEYRLYDPRSYEALKKWLGAVSHGLDQPADVLMARAADACPQMGAFLDNAGFARTWPGLQKNNPDPARRLAQFHRWFDGFRTIKLLHYLRDNGYPDADMFGAIRRALEWHNKADESFDWDGLNGDLSRQQTLLEILRRLERETE